MKYKITLDTSGQKYESEGGTVEEAFDKLDLNWLDIKSKGMMTVSCGKQKTEHLFVLLQLRRLFRNKFLRKLWITRFNYLLNGNNL